MLPQDKFSKDLRARGNSTSPAAGRYMEVAHPFVHRGVKKQPGERVYVLETSYSPYNGNMVVVEFKDKTVSSPFSAGYFRRSY